MSSKGHFCPRAIMPITTLVEQKGHIMANSTSIIRDVTFNFAKVYKSEVNPFGKDQFDIQLEFGKERAAEMSQYGKIRALPNGNMALNISRPAKNNKGQKAKIRVVDSEKNEMTDGIGNGSTGNVMVYSYDWNVAGKSGRKTILIAVQVMDLKEYNPEATIDFDIVVNEGDTQAAPANDF